jgi:ATP-dependent helicase Lhr and Lhr-like helicase
LAEARLVAEGDAVHLFTWRGDATQDALAAILRDQGLSAANHGVSVLVEKTSITDLRAVLAGIAKAPCPTPAAILNRRVTGNPEKWDWVLPDRLMFDSFASSRLDLVAAHEICRRVA